MEKSLNKHIIGIVRKFHVENPNYDNRELSLKFNITVESVEKSLNTPIKIVRSSYNKNLYFVFDNFTERNLIVDFEKSVQNQEYFLAAELSILKTYGFKC